MDVKYLYCPKCKELRVKPWYSVTDRCSRCRGDVRVIEVPRTARSFAVYAMMGAALVFAYLHLQTDTAVYLYSAVAFIVITMVLQFQEVLGGERYARAKIKITHSDSDAMRKKGWR